MTLSQKQQLFMQLLGHLLVWIYKQPGYAVAGGELLRTQAQAAANAASGAGISNSLHLQKLAIDLALFVDGVYQTASEPYKPLGDYWKSLNPLCRWGGDFRDKHGRPKPDGNHFSITHNGIS